MEVDFGIFEGKWNKFAAYFLTIKKTLKCLLFKIGYIAIGIQGWNQSNTKIKPSTLNKSLQYYTNCIKCTLSRTEFDKASRGSTSFYNRLKPKTNK